ncbi:cupin-like domain-containing protein [Chytridium lagenaria]|nr:cupin-like domain-containing protein [Chytridium lagenaria]
MSMDSDFEDDEDQHRFTNEYIGFHPPKTSWKPDRVSPSIDPATFFAKYVATRTPCIFTSALVDKEWKASDRWTPSYLKTQAGDAVVQVETRKDAHDTFGSGRPRIQALFRDVVDDLLEGNTDIYLSTQYIQALKPAHDDADTTRIAIGHEFDLVERFEEFCGQPLRRLLGDFPLRPKVMGGLVPQQVNLWLGASGETGSSSGLHHESISVRKMHKVHSNGLMQFDGGKIRGDGAYVGDVLRWKLRKAKKHLEDVSGTAEEKRAKKDVEQAAFALMEYQADDEDIEDEDLGLIDDDYQDDDEGEEEMVMEDEEEEDDEEEEGENEFAEDEAMIAEDDDDDDDEDPSEPPSFSKINPKILHGSEMLYLPASWFHEVHSYPPNASKSPIHLAFNYWYHPPTTSSFKSPYEDPYWEERWREMTSLLDGQLGPMASLMARRIRDLGWFYIKWRFIAMGMMMMADAANTIITIMIFIFKS